MTENDDPIPSDEYRVIVKNVPIVSVDLLVHHKGGLVLGKRRNEPVKGEWFIPGGTVLKGERLTQAVHRVANQEINADITIDRQLGIYEHLYTSADQSGVDSKHYLATAFVVTPVENELHPDDQHESLQVFSEPFPDFHDYVNRYIRDLQALGYEY